MRVVSLVPSATETLLALGVDVVACTRFCEQPLLPHVGGTKDPDVDAIVGLAPDLVVLDEEENRREDAIALRAAGVDLLVTAVRSVAGALSAVGELAARTGASPPFGEPGSPPGSPVRRALIPIWRRPWMALGSDTYGASVLEHAGIAVVTGGAPGRYPSVEPGELAADPPDLVLVPSEPYPFRARHLEELAAALPASEIRRVDGQDLFWWGIRTPGAVARIESQLGATRPGRRN